MSDDTAPLIYGLDLDMLRQFVSKATRPKLPGGLLLSPGLSLRVPSKGALSAPGGAGFILYRRANPIPYCEQVGQSPVSAGRNSLIGN
jgi:hypothetical protein